MGACPVFACARALPACRAPAGLLVCVTCSQPFTLMSTPAVANVVLPAVACMSLVVQDLAALICAGHRQAILPRWRLCRCRYLQFQARSRLEICRVFAARPCCGTALYCALHFNMHTVSSMHVPPCRGRRRRTPHSSSHWQQSRSAVLAHMAQGLCARMHMTLLIHCVHEAHCGLHAAVALVSL